MSTDSTVPPLFERLVDDAALFPPGNAPMPDAVAAHARHRASPYAGLVGRFLFPASRLGELRQTLAPDARPLAVGVIANVSPTLLPKVLAEIRSDARLGLEALEIAVPVAADDPIATTAAVIDALPDDLDAYVEVPRGRHAAAALDQLAALGSGDVVRGAKLRTGGLAAKAFPEPAEVAAFISGCVERGIPFKCTAGLHHAVRHLDPETGFVHHGFLNVLVATGLAATRTSAADLEEVLTWQDASALTKYCTAVSAQDALVTRAAFVGFGSCSIDDPVHDLTELGLL